MTKSCDLIVRSARVIDGSGSPGFQGDVAVDGGRFLYVGPACPGRGRLEIDGTGRVAAPGFVDIHSHSDYYLLVNSRAESKIRQGVTTEIGGNCGYSAAPVSGRLREERLRTYADLFGLDLPWDGVDGYLEHLAHRGTSVNFALLIGHNTVRASVMYGSDQPPSTRQLSEMVRMVEAAMADGAVGLSTGLIYPPGCFSQPAELVALCEVVREFGGIFAVHMRSEGNRLLEAIDEAVGVAEQARIPLQISHLKTSGRRNWKKLDEAFARIESARDRGVDVTCDRYPYTASNTGLSAVLPEWVFEGGTDRMLARLSEKKVREAVREAIAAEHPEDDYYDRIMIAAVTRPENRVYAGRRVSECARAAGMETLDFIAELLIGERGMVDAIYFTMSSENLRRILEKPYVMIGSDSGAKGVDGPLGDGSPHPRAFGTFPRVLQQYVRDEGVLSLEAAVRKMTSDPLRRIGITDRGFIRQGLAADLVLFDPESIADVATYEAPRQYPRGIELVVVNGEVVLRHGEHTGKTPGQIVTSSAGASAPASGRRPNGTVES